MHGNKSKPFSVFLFILCLAILMSGCFQTENTGSQDKTTAAVPLTPTEAPDDGNTIFAGKTIKIGVLLSLTGDDAICSLKEQQGIELAATEINDSGGLLGGQVELVYADGKSTIDDTMAAHGSMISQKDIPAIIGLNDPSAAAALGPAIREAGIAMLSGSTSPRLLQFSQANPYLFYCRANDSIHAAAAANFLVNDLGCTMIGISYTSDDYGIAAMEAAAAWLHKNHIEYVAAGHDTGDNDFSRQIEKFQNAGADGIISWTYESETAIFVRRLKETGYTGELVSSGSLNEPELLNLVSADMVKGYFACVDFARGNNSPKAFEIERKINAAENESLSAFFVLGYDSLYVLKDAVERARSLDRKAVAEALRKTSGLQLALGAYTCDAGKAQTMIHESVIVQMGPDKTAAIYKII
ncbi:MAG: ABC transporter substrate-binding protein [Christensenellales bacterium]